MLEEERQRLLITAFKDKDSAMYKSMMAVLRDCTASEQRAKLASSYVGFPFALEAGVQAALEDQFSVRIRCAPSGKRMPLTDRVAGMVCLADAALLEHAGGMSRDVLMLDGDVMTMVALGVEGRLIERTYATPRLVTGYHLEDEQLHKTVTSRTSKLCVRADLIHAELVAGGGEHYWASVRSDGPAVDSIVVNGFKTPCGASQLAYLALCRKAVVFGCVPFQPEMLTSDSGPLECFPGMFYIDRVLDSMTLVPEQDAAQSLTIPFSAWREIIMNNSVTVSDTEFLCEKYSSVKGVVYYTLSSVDMDFEVPERLRTNYFDKKKLNVVELRFPKVRFSKQGVPVGWDRGVVSVPADRYEKVLSRVMCSDSEIVTPAEVFTVFTEHNNTVLNSMDSVQLAKRMSVSSEMDAAMAVALHVNWTRHAAKKSFNFLLDAVKLRYDILDASLARFAMIALVTWWNKPDVRGTAMEGEIPVSDVRDWCGNDFSVLMEAADPWIEVVQDAGYKQVRAAKFYPWMPRPKMDRTSSRFVDILKRVRNAVWVKDGDEVSGSERRCAGAVAYSAPRPSGSGFAPVSVGSSAAVSSVVVNGTTGVVCRRDKAELTDLKLRLRRKLADEQGASRTVEAVRENAAYDVSHSDSIPMVPVPDVDPKSAIRDDLLMVNKGPFTGLGPSTGFRIADSDIRVNVVGNFRLNDSKRDVPKPKYVRLPLVDAGVEGKRPSSQASLFGAMKKRNIGVPNNRGSVDLDNIATHAMDRIIATCFRTDWQEVVEKHLDAGMWQCNYDDIENFLSNVDEKKVNKMLEEFFSNGEIDLQKWNLMAKGNVKPSRDADAGAKIDHPQTIMFLENSSANAAFSAQVRHCKECLDECLRPEVSLNSQKSDAEQEEWYNSLESHRASFPRTYSFGSDIRCFDRSQEKPTSRIHMEFYRRMGLNRETLEKWASMYGVKRAACMMLGIVAYLYEMGVSGVFDTLLRNMIVNLAAIVVGGGLQRSDIVTLDVKGDDMDGEFSRPIRVETMIEKMSLEFNFSAKIFTNDVRYFCKQFRVKFEERWVFLPDPWARVQSLCRPLVMGNHEDDLQERYMSLKADLRHYDNGLLVDLAAECAQVYYQCERPLYGMARGLANIVRDSKAFYSFFGPITRID